MNFSNMSDVRTRTEVAEKVTELFLSSLRSGGQKQNQTLHEYRLALWQTALGSSYHIADEIYKQWLLLRYKYLKVKPEVKSLLVELRHSYRLAIITNGKSEAQWEKVELTGLSPFFNAVVVSDDVPWEKPDINIFYEACRLLNVDPDSCLMIGDRVETDIKGANEAGFAATVWIEHNAPYQLSPGFCGITSYPDYTISDVLELRNILQ